MSEELKIVTYNVNGLRPRISQFGSLRKLLDAIDADIVCFQETKLSKLDLRADLVRADGYESFFSCNRCSEKGRIGYSGVATFCRVRSAFSSDEVALPVAAEDGFTGLLENSSGFGSKKDDFPSFLQELEGFSRDELLKVDSEGRCVITDHGHFVLFNVYGPRACSDDTERIQFKLTFYQILQRRWEILMRKGRRIFVVGDLNIAPSAIDRCDAEPDFEKNKFRRWFRSLLLNNGGQFLDVFRTKHPDRKDAYTCWSTNTGAVEFNFGSRIDHILITGSCIHEEANTEGHDLLTCHVKECDILTQFKRWKPGNTLRWKEGRSMKLEGSDHVPVCMSLVGIPGIRQHNTPSLSTRYSPQVHGRQQTLVSMLMKKELTEQAEEYGGSCYFPGDNSNKNAIEKPVSCIENRKKPRKSLGAQLSLKSFFTTTSSPCKSLNTNSDKSTLTPISVVITSCSDFNAAQTLVHHERLENDHDDEVPQSLELEHDEEVPRSLEIEHDEEVPRSLEIEKKSSALMEWQRIQQLMQNSIPLCKGHKEACVVRIVKKSGPNMGRRFYVCARSEGPASNPEANCGYFKWAASKSKG